MLEGVEDSEVLVPLVLGNEDIVLWEISELEETVWLFEGDEA